MTKLPKKSLEGRRIRLVQCSDPHTHIRAGTEGTVTLVDDAGTVHVKWDDGQQLGLVWEAGDRWTIIVAT